MQLMWGQKCSFLKMWRLCQKTQRFGKAKMLLQPYSRLSSRSICGIQCAVFSHVAMQGVISVLQAGCMAIEVSTDRAAEMMVELLKSLTISNIITPDQFVKVRGAKTVSDWWWFMYDAHWTRFPYLHEGHTNLISFMNLLMKEKHLQLYSVEG